MKQKAYLVRETLVLEKIIYASTKKEAIENWTVYDAGIVKSHRTAKVSK